MKFGNFENIGKKTKNLAKATLLVTFAGLSAGSVMGQSEVRDDLKTAKLFETFKSAGAIDTSMTEVEFSKFTDAQMQEAVDNFKKATGRMSPEEFAAKKAKIMEQNPNSTSKIVDVVKYKVNTKETKEEVLSKQEVASFDQWYAKQKDGAVVKWTIEEGGDGRVIKIDRDSNNKSLYANAPKVKSSPVIEDTNETMASTSEAYVFAEDHFKNQNQK